MKVVVTGSHGMLAQDLLPRLENTGINVIGLDLPEINITQKRETFHVLKAENPSLLINCAAYTSVDKAESEHSAAFAVNYDGAAILAEACHRLNIHLLHISTDYVFNGYSKLRYREEDPADPLSIYGRSKWEGEEAIRIRQSEHIIVRTAWLFGVHGSNFVKTMLRLAREREELRVVDDQIGCPTWSGDLAEALVKIVFFLRDRDNFRQWGTYHFCGMGRTTWYGFACAILEEARKYEPLTVKKITPIATNQYPTPAPRPALSVLDTEKINRVFGIKPMYWRQSLNKMLKELYQ